MFSIFRRNPAIEFEPLQSSLAHDCAVLHAKAFAHPWSYSEIESLSTSENVTADAALLAGSGKLAGFAISRLAVDEAEILTIVVDAPFRGQGIGQRMLEFHLDVLRRKRIKIIFLEVDENNAAARRMYVRQGFAVVGRREAYYRDREGRTTAALVMRRNIS